MPRAVAISPHLDDAAFSCGGTLALMARAGWQVTLCTLFTRSARDPGPFALACQLDKGLPQEADYMAIRRAEDAQACALLGVTPVWLDFPEAPHRGYDSPAALFGTLRPDDEVHLDLAAALADVLRVAPDVVLAPQAVGGHVDHIQAVHALRLAFSCCTALSSGVTRPSAPTLSPDLTLSKAPIPPAALIGPPRLPVLWWTDFPYAARPHTHPSRPFEREMADLPIRCVEGDAVTRLSACAAYETQLGFQFGGRAGLADTLSAAGAVERFRAEGDFARPVFVPLRLMS